MDNPGFGQPQSFYGKRKKDETARQWEKKLKKIEQAAAEMSAHPPPKLYKPRINDPCIYRKTFFRQEDAFRFVRSKSEELHVFAYESDMFPEESAGKRMYMVCSYPHFWHYYCQMSNPSLRHHYEVIPEGAVSKLYFDLEFKKQFNREANGNKMVDTLIKLMTFHLSQLYGITCTRSDILELDASTDVKFSRHLIFLLKNAAFKDNIHAGNFVHHVCHQLLTAFDRNMMKDAACSSPTVSQSGDPICSKAFPVVVSIERQEFKDSESVAVKSNLAQKSTDDSKEAFCRVANFDARKSSELDGLKTSFSQKMSALFSGWDYLETNYGGRSETRSTQTSNFVVKCAQKTKPHLTDSNLTTKEHISKEDKDDTDGSSSCMSKYRNTDTGTTQSRSTVSKCSRGAETKSTDSRYTRQDSSNQPVTALFGDSKGDDADVVCTEHSSEKLQDRIQEVVARQSAPPSPRADKDEKDPDSTNGGSVAFGIAISDLQELLVGEDDGEKKVLFCDMGVYTRNRNFRLYLSSKLGKHNPLVVAANNLYTPSIPAKSNRKLEEQIFLDSLVSNVSYSPSLKVLTCDVAGRLGLKGRGSRSHKKHHGDTYDPALEGYNASPYPEIDDFITGLLDKDGVKGTIRSWSFFSQGELLLYEISKYRWCGNVKRHHKSNNIIL